MKKPRDMALETPVAPKWKLRNLPRPEPKEEEEPEEEPEKEPVKMLEYSTIKVD